LKKKKKKPVETSSLNEESGDAGEDFDDHVGEDEEGEGIVLHTRYPWEGTDRDYEYEEVYYLFLCCLSSLSKFILS
jgi:translation initiation factor 2 subunit 2